jgi:hypothetical protein
LFLNKKEIMSYSKKLYCLNSKYFCSLIIILSTSSIEANPDLGGPLKKELESELVSRLLDQQAAYHGWQGCEVLCEKRRYIGIGLGALVGLGLGFKTPKKVLAVHILSGIGAGSGIAEAINKWHKRNGIRMNDNLREYVGKRGEYDYLQASYNNACAQVENTQTNYVKVCNHYNKK